MEKLIKYYVLLFCMLCLLPACSLVEKPFNYTEQAAEYAEALFKRQNLLTQQVMMFDDELSADDEAVLSKAEVKMHESCRLLNEYANREMDGKPISLFFRRRVQGSFTQCEQSVDEMAHWLERISITPASD